VHLAFYIPVTIWGALAMLWYGVDVGATAAMARAARAPAEVTTTAGVAVHELAQLPPVRADEPASAFTLAMVEAVVVPEGHEPERTALADTATFVHGQLRALPPELRVMFDCGMLFFRTITRLRYVRGYCDLSLETRRRWVKAWAESRYGIFRKLMKPVRSVALLAYHDHPKMREALVGGAELYRPKWEAKAASAAAPVKADVP
jgi:hypothetical protein